MRLTESQEHQLFKLCISEGVDLSYGKLSLCDLRNYWYAHVRRDRRYQVHSEDNKLKWSGIYDDLDAAINKFIHIKHRIRGNR